MNISLAACVTLLKTSIDHRNVLSSSLPLRVYVQHTRMIKVQVVPKLILEQEGCTAEFSFNQASPSPQLTVGAIKVLENFSYSRIPLW